MVHGESEQVIQLNNMETKTFLETKLRNLKRKNAKLSQHAEFADEYMEINKEIQDIKAQLSALQ